MNESAPAVVLVEPQLGENIGAAARAMRNFGLSRLVLVNPRDGWPNPSATAMASGAGSILDAAADFPDIESALAGAHFVLATTARSRELSKPVHMPERAMQEARTRIAAGQRVAVLFGPERSGLSNHDVSVANAIIEVPTVPSFKSLNVAQCVLLIAYEWRRSGLEAERFDSVPGGDSEPATLHEKVILFEQHLNDLSASGYFWPETKAASMKMSLRNMFLRHEFSAAEVRTLHGIRNSLRRHHPDLANRPETGRESKEQ